MTRELEFRAWANGYEKWCEWIDYNVAVWIGTVNTTKRNYTTTDVTVEQYTGLKDKNGLDIYEGDIIKVVNLHDGDEECWKQPYGPAIPQEVKWDEEWLRWSFGGCGRILYAPEDFEVIGNIHENPELLRGAE